MQRTIEILGEEFEVLDVKEKMTVPDCFVLKNKIGSAHGEAKFYVGQRNDVSYKFFDRLGDNCFFLKSDILDYLQAVKEEYQHPQQPYRKTSELPNDWKEYSEKANSISEEKLPFSMEPQSQIKGQRFYLNSKDSIYKFIREISLPNITYLASLKIKDATGKVFYYFRLFVDYFGEEEHPTIIKEEIKDIQEDNTIADEEKKTLVRARVGQGKYRKALLDLCPFCPITMISEDRILIASHIKPWVDSTNQEKIDPLNGFMFTPTFDFLFDKGYISFNDDKTILICSWLSNMTLSKLNISPGKKYPQLPIEGREEYLEYHRKNIFKK